MATYGSGLKVAGAATAGGSVPANSFAIVFYTCSSISPPSGTPYSSGTYSISPTPCIRVFGPGATIPSTFTSNVRAGVWYLTNEFSGSTFPVTYSFAGGVIISN